MPMALYLETSPRLGPLVVLIVTSPFKWLPMIGSSDGLTSTHFSSPSKVPSGGTNPGSNPEPSSKNPSFGSVERPLLTSQCVGCCLVRKRLKSVSSQFATQLELGRSHGAPVRMSERLASTYQQCTYTGELPVFAIWMIVSVVEFTRTFGKMRIEAPFSIVTSACTPPATTPRTSALAHRPERNAFHFTIRIASSFPIDRTQLPQSLPRCQYGLVLCPWHRGSARIHTQKSVTLSRNITPEKVGTAA